jgi:hypothetical protein
MGWVADKFDGSPQSNPQSSSTKAAEQTFETSAENAWKQLTAGFQADVKEINARKGDANFKELSDHQSRISSTVTKLAAVVTADLSAHTIQYVYEPEDAQTAIPEQGVLTMRPSGSGIELYSADERLTSDRARRLILEPLFFTGMALDATGT